MTTQQVGALPGVSAQGKDIHCRLCDEWSIRAERPLGEISTDLLAHIPDSTGHFGRTGMRRDAPGRAGTLRNAPGPGGGLLRRAPVLPSNYDQWPNHGLKESR